MFTGLVREVGRLRSQRSVSGLTVLEITAPKVVASGLAIGDSLAVNGICLTITTMTADRVRVDASAETRRVTTLADWRVGQALHLEPALRSGDPLALPSPHR
jgi:riboflavin synthase